jgi:thioredoxin 2
MSSSADLPGHGNDSERPTTYPELDAARLPGYRRVVCPHCNAVNQVANADALSEALCLRCGEPQFSGTIVDLTPKRFQRHVHDSDLPVVVLFWSPELPSTYSLNGTFELAAAHLEPAARFARVNIQEHEALAHAGHATHAPLVVVFRDGKAVANWPKEVGLEMLVRWIRTHLGVDGGAGGSL